jgi:hypothetical protein
MRQALYGGLGGVCGATGGWLIWVALQVLHENPWEVVLSIAIGAGLSLLINKFIEPYLHVAREESSPGHAHGKVVGHPLRLATLFLLFLFLALEHLASHVIHAVWLPFLLSLATLFPAGALVGLCFPKKEPAYDSSWLWNAIRGALLGAVVGLVTMAAQFPINSRAVFPEPIQFGLLGWWVLMGMGFGISYGESRRGQSGIRPVFGGLIALVLVFLFSLPGPRRLMPDKVPVILMPLIWVADTSVDQLLSAPELPANFWQEAEHELSIKRAEDGHEPAGGEENAAGEEAAGKSHWGTVLADWLGCISESVPENADQVPRDPVGKNRSLKLRRALERGFGSGFVRSWLVMLLFSLGISLGSVVEWTYLPQEYATSQTRKNDVRFLAGTVAATACALAVVAIAWPGPWKSFSSPGGNFRLLMPGTPDLQTLDLPVRGRELKMALHNYEVTLSNHASFKLGYVDYPGPLDQPIFKQSTESRIAAINGRVVASPKSIAFNDHPGTEYQCEASLSTGPFVGFCRMYLVERRIYFLQAFLPKDHADAAIATKFLDSFELIKKQPAALDDASWKDFIPKGGDCSLKMPGTPLAVGTNSYLVGATLSAGAADFQFAYQDVNLFTVPREAALDELVKSSSNGQLLSKERIALNGYPGWDFKWAITIDGRSAVARSRAYIVGSRLYRLTVVLWQHDADPSDVHKFFNSFKLTKTGTNRGNELNFGR